MSPRLSPVVTANSILKRRVGYFDAIVISFLTCCEESDVTGFGATLTLLTFRSGATKRFLDAHFRKACKFFMSLFKVFFLISSLRFRTKVSRLCCVISFDEFGPINRS